MARKNGAQAAPAPVPMRADRFSIYADRTSGAAFRRYCLKHGITFTELAVAAIAYYIEHCDPPKRQTLKLPRGSRLRSDR